jgi:GDP-4-dehydro-6-deoxy-D-mannose reductase
MTFVEPGGCVAVTGATGFVGQTLVEHLVASGFEVIGISDHPEPAPRISRLLRQYICADLTNGWPDMRPIHGLVHLAGLAAVQPSFGRPQDYLNINSSIVTHMFEHALRAGWAGRALIVSSGAVYGSVTASDQPGFVESSPTAATSPYVVSKLLVEIQAEYYGRQGIDAMVVRPFNHIGPGQGPGFIVPDLKAKVVDWQPGTAVTVGNLDSSRDYTDVRDIVRAYRLLLEKCDPRHRTYNVCSGSAHSGHEVLEAVCTALGRPIPPTKVVADRAIDPHVITGNAQRLRLETGWEPTITLQQSIRDFVNSEPSHSESPCQDLPIPR